MWDSKKKPMLVLQYLPLPLHPPPLDHRRLYTSQSQAWVTSLAADWLVISPPLQTQTLTQCPADCSLIYTVSTCFTIMLYNLMLLNTAVKLQLWRISVAVAAMNNCYVFRKIGRISSQPFTFSLNNIVFCRLFTQRT